MRRWIVVGALGVVGCGASKDSAGPSAFRVALTADWHIIDAFYTCCESNDLDTKSLQESERRLTEARAAILALDPPVEAVFVAGDVIHEYPSADRAFFDNNTTAFDTVVGLRDGFGVPVYLGLGNHDYSTPEVSRETTHELIKSKWGIDPYYAVDLHGWRFLMLDNQLGPTWDATDPLYNDDVGSFGPEQLAWVDAQLAEGLPSVLFMHNPPVLLQVAEDPSGPYADLFVVLEAHPNVQAVFTGHMHLWMDWTSVWPGYGLAATRYDPRNYLVMEIDPAAGTWEIPQLDEVEIGSYWYDGVEPL
jgi:hypothetical protein